MTFAKETYSQNELIPFIQEAMHHHDWPREAIPPSIKFGMGEVHRCGREKEYGYTAGDHALFLYHYRNQGTEPTRINYSSLGVSSIPMTKKEIVEADRKAEAEERKRLENQKKATEKASALYNRLVALSMDTEYSKRKQIKLFKGIRNDQTDLIIPFRDIDGQLRTIQTISNDGQKRWFPGAPKRGAFYILDELEIGRQIFVCEGYATAASVYEATGVCTVMVGDSGNIAEAIKNIRGKYPNLEIIICADDDWCNKDDSQRNDSDNPGRKYAIDAAELWGCNVVFPDVRNKFMDDASTKPATDFNDIDILYGLDEVKRQITETVIKVEDHCAAHNIKILNHLASLSSIEYDQNRKEAAKTLGVKVSTLDREVKTLRQATDEDNVDIFPMIDPWHEPVMAETLLREIVQLLRRLVILPEHAGETIALWIILTYFIEVVSVLPILALSSPEKRCGKTTLLSVLLRLARRPLPASNITPSALFRSIELWKPTIFIDEADTFLKDSEELRGVINSGHTKPTAFVIRTVGESHTPTKFNTWGAKAIALIGKLPDTIHDRSIVIELRRKLNDEKTQKIRDVNDQVFTDLQRQLLRFARDHKNAVEKARPTLPSTISDRAADNWEPLLAIAELAGPSWLNKAYQAASDLSDPQKDILSSPNQLLEDIKHVFDHHHISKISTKDLLGHLCENDEKEWATWNRGNPLTPIQLARKLKPYGVTSKNLRCASNVVKGFEKSQFEDIWKRYIVSSQSPSGNTATPLQNPSKLDTARIIDVADNYFSNDTGHNESATNSAVVATETKAATAVNQSEQGLQGFCSGVATHLESVLHNVDYDEGEC